MSNDYYNGGTFPTTGSAATSASMRAELSSVTAGFDKLPTLTGNGGKTVKVNAGGTALEAVTATAGDVSGPSSSVASEIALFDGTTGKLLKSATTTGILKGTSGVLSAATAGTDYAKPDTTSTWSAYQVLSKALQEAKAAISASDIDLRAANYFTKTISTNTTFTVSNVPSTGTSACFLLDLTNGGAATVTWWSGMKWAGGVAPSLTASGRDVLGFFTHDGGTTWSGFLLGKDVK